MAAHSGKHLSCKDKDLSLISRSRIWKQKKASALLYTLEVILLVWQWHVDLWACWAGRLPYLLISRAMEDSDSTQKVCDTWRTAPLVVLWPSHTPMHTSTFIHTWSNFTFPCSLSSFLHKLLLSVSRVTKNIHMKLKLQKHFFENCINSLKAFYYNNF